MSNEEKQIKNVDKDLIKQFKTTEEYNQWQESLFAIIGYSSREELDDENLIMELMADHLNASLQLNKGLDKARFKTKKELHEDWMLDNSGQ